MSEWMVFLLEGFIAGWLAGVLMKGGGFGVIGDLVLGVVGSVFGAWLFRVVGLAAYGFTGAVLMALAGSVALIALARAFKRV